MDYTSRMVALLRELRRERNGAVADSMRYYGTPYGLNYGVSLPTLRRIARAEAPDHGFARYLYRQDVRELRLAALHIACPACFTPEEFPAWAAGIVNSEIAEEAAFALLSRAEAFPALFSAWIASPDALLQYAALLAAARTGKAQVFPNSYINVDWQVGVPLGSSLADKASGWGMNFEGGYFITPAIAVGPFISYQTNLETIPRQTLDLGNGSALTVNQKHSVFQLPFGVTSRYTWLTDSVFQPYAGLKLGANYAELSSYYYVVKQYNDTWGFFLSPEIGVSIFPRPDYRFGFHVALYYSYATNSGDVLTYSVNNLNNFGIRVGISF